MKRMRWMMITAALVAGHSLCGVRAHAGLFKLDFGDCQKIAQRVTLTNWDTFPDWTFTDFPDGIATWKLTDFSADNNTNVTLTIMDNAALSAQLGDPAIGMGGNDPDAQGLDAVYDGINVPAAVKDDYLWRNLPDAGTEILFRFANLAPGQYHVTLFDGRVSDQNGQYGKVWIDDVSGKNEPAAQNTGDFSANPLSDPSDTNSTRVPIPWGHPQTLVVNIKAGDYLWYAHMEDGWGGISGMIIRSWVDSDGDGMPDDWEIQYGLNPHDPSDAATDLNGNGLSNFMEYTCGLDPRDTTKPTILSAVADAAHNKVEVTFSKPIYLGSGIVNDPRDATLATNLANYSISPALAISGVGVKGNVVTLSTAKQTPSATTYTLTVNSMRDVNNWPVTANSQAAFVISPPPVPPSAQPYQWFTIAGLAGVTGSADGTNSDARFNYPNDVAVDSAGNLYLADLVNHTIRKITREGTNWVTTTIAGSAGFSGSDDGTNSDARFNYPIAIVVDRAGNLYVEDNDNCTIRKITPVGTNWVTTTIAGLAGEAGYRDGTNSDARFQYPNGLAVDSAGNLYVGEDQYNTIRKITPVGTDWVTTTIAGLAGQAGGDDGINSAARFNGPTLLKVDSHGTLFAPDQNNSTIRMGVPVPVFQNVTPTGGRNELVLSAAPGQTVQLQYSSDLASTSWTNLGSPITATTGTISATDTPGPDQRRFYRALVVLP